MMPSLLIDNLRKQLDGPRDGAMLRLALGRALLEAGDSSAAIEQLRAAVGFDANYSAAWKHLGKALTQSGDSDAARDAYENGIAAAQRRGDKQAGKEMQVFLKRLLKSP